MPDDRDMDSSLPGDEEPAAQDASATEEDESKLVREELEEALREKEQFRAMAQRAQADLINYKRRVTEEQDELRTSARSHLLTKVLSLADDLDRAIALLPDDSTAPGWREGLELVQRNLVRMLDSEGVTKIEAEGKPFEPWEHEAVLHEATPDGQEGMVVKVIRDGYKLRDRVLRPAQVTVSKSPEPHEEQETTQEESE